MQQLWGRVGGVLDHSFASAPGGGRVQTLAGNVTCLSLSASVVTLLSIFVQKLCESLWDMSFTSAGRLDRTTTAPLGQTTRQSRGKNGEKDGCLR